MGLAIEKGVITAPGATGNQTYNLGAAFSGITPKAVILWASYETVAGDTADDGIYSVGWGTFDGDLVQQGRTSYFDDDAVATSSTTRAKDTGSCLRGYTALGAGDYEVDLVSFGSGQFILDWPDAPASAIKVHYFAIGGNDVTAARAGSFSVDTTAGDDIDVTVAAGWGQPDLLLFMVSMAPGTGVANSHTSVDLGVAKSDTERRANQMQQASAKTAMAVVSWQAARAVLQTTGGAATAEMEGDLSARANWPVDGFRYNNIDAPASATTVLYLALKGTFTATIGADVAPIVGSPPVAQNLALASGTPKGALFWSNNIAATAGVTSSDADLGTWTMGGMDGTNEGCATVGNDDGNTDSWAWRGHSESKALRLYSEPTSATTAGVLESEADATLSGRNVNLSWNDIDGVAREFNYLILGEPPALLWSPTPPAVFYR